MPHEGENPKRFNHREHLTSRHRLRGFDYHNPGYYFVTICINHRLNLLGRINGGEVVLSGAGLMVGEVVEAVGSTFSGVDVDSFVVMPNHIHVLLYLPLDGPGTSLSDVVRWIKGVSTSIYGRGVREFGWPPYDKRFWQKGYNDQIIRDDVHLTEVRRYIEENPVKWEQDELFGWY